MELTLQSLRNIQMNTVELSY